MEGDDEKIREQFICTHCSELVYNPMVFHCGHFFCCGCVEQLLSPNRINECPICKGIMGHLPYICSMISSLTEFLYPKTFVRRAIEYGDKGPEDLDLVAGMEQVFIWGTAQREDQLDESDKLEEIFDILTCSLCKCWLTLPIVTTCGHVYCEGCLLNRMDNDSFDCVVCDTYHYNWKPVICLGLNSYIAEFFPNRSKIKKLQLVKFTFKLPNSQWWSDIKLVQSGRRCFRCSIYPIIGDRYSCDVCDLNCCFECFTIFGKPSSGISWFPNHTDEHEISIYPPISVRDKILAEAAKSPEDNSPIRRKSEVHVCMEPDEYGFTFEGRYLNIIKYVTIK